MNKQWQYVCFTIKIGLGIILEGSRENQNMDIGQENFHAFKTRKIYSFFSEIKNILLECHVGIIKMGTIVYSSFPVSFHTPKPAPPPNSLFNCAGNSDLKP